jgi:hypothetical protein
MYYDPRKMLTSEDDRRSQMFVDQELGAGDAEQFASRIQASSTLRSHAEAHSALRAAVGRALGDDVAAPELRARIATLLRGREADVVGRIGSNAPKSDVLARHFWDGPRRASLLAIVASLAFVAGAVLFGIFGPTIGQMAARHAGTPMTEVAAHATGEHTRCSEDEAQRAAKAPFRTPERAYAELSAHLGRPVEIMSLEALGYEFCCAGFCGVPGAESCSGHVMYRKRASTLGGEAEYWVSVFVVPADVPYFALDAFGRSVTLAPGELYAESPNNDSFRNPASRVYGWTDGELTYFVRLTNPVDAPHVIGELAPQFKRGMPSPRVRD